MSAGPVRTLAEVAAALGGELRGDGGRAVRRPVPPGLARDEGDLAVALQPEALAALAGSPARMAVLPRDAPWPAGLEAGVVVARGPAALARLLALFAREPYAAPGVHPRAEVDPTAVLGEGVRVGPFSCVGPGARIGRGSVLLDSVSVGAGARLGEGCLLHPGVRVGERVVLGDRVIVHGNAVLGADGFSFATTEEGSVESARQSGRVLSRNTRIERIPSLGTVEIGDDVEIGAGTTIDRATLDATRVGAGTRVDDQVLIAHNATVGRNCLIAGQVGLSGSCRLGDRVVLAGGVGVADHICIGDDAIVMAGSGVARHVPPGAVVAGSPALPRAQFHAQLLDLRRLRRLHEEVVELRRQVAALARNPAGP